MGQIEIVPAAGSDLDTAASGRLAALDAAPAQYVTSQQPANTARAYAADWRAWSDYTAAIGIPAAVGSSGALVGFVRWLEHAGAAPATIDRRLAGAVVRLREHGVPVDHAATRAARTALGGYRRRLTEANVAPGRGRASAVTVQQLREITAACPPGLAGARDRALVLLGFTTAARRSELAGLLVSDVRDTDDGLVVTIRYGKTGAREVAVPFGSHPQTCPVRAWRDWLAATGTTTGPAFRRIDRHGRLLDAGLSPQAAGDVITRAGLRAGLPARLTGHSVRAGLATEARRAGHDAKTIAAQGGWKPNSAVLYDYMRIVDRWSDNAATGLGL